MDKQIPNTDKLVKKTDCNTKIMEIENQISHITSMATKADLNAKATEIEIKIPDTSHFINTQELTNISFDGKIIEAVKRLASKNWSKRWSRFRNNNNNNNNNNNK